MDEGHATSLAPGVAWLRAPAFGRGALGEGRGRLGAVTLPAVAFVVGALVLAALFSASPTVTFAGGLGGDGFLYAQWIRAYRGDVQDIGLHAYSAQRVIAIVVVRTILDLAHAEPTNEAIIRVFRVLDAACIIAALGFTCLSTRFLGLTRAGFLVAIFATYFNYAFLSFLPFDPVLTDSMAVLASACAGWLYLARRPVALACTTIVASFVWPGFGYAGIAMLLLPRAPAGPRAATPDATPHMADHALAALAAAALTVAAAGHAADPVKYEMQPTSMSLLRLSLGLLAVLGFAALRDLVRVGHLARELARLDRDALVGKALAIVVYGAVSWGIAWVSARAAEKVEQHLNLGARDVIGAVLARAVQRPLVFVWAHASYFGPVVPMLVLAWRGACAEARRVGAGVWAVLGLAFVLGLNAESRGLFTAIPIVAPLAVLSAARWPWTPRRLLELGAIFLGASKLWYSVVQQPTLDWSTYFAHFGPWMSNGAVLVHAIATLAVLGWMLWLRGQSPPAGERIALATTP